MRVAVVYYSLTGNSRMVAEYISSKTGASVYEVLPEKPLKPDSFLKYIEGGKQVFFKEQPEIKELDFPIDEYDAVVFCSPVWACSIAPALRSFIAENNISGKKAGLVCSHKGLPGCVAGCLNKLLPDSEIMETLSLYEPLAKEPERVHQLIDLWLQENILSQ